MNTLREKLQKDLVEAIKKKDTIKKEVIKLILGRIIIEEKNPNGKEITDDLILSFVKSQLKNTKEALIDFEKGDRQDLIKQSQMEIDILMSYLPKQLTEDQIKEICLEKKKELNIENIGPKEIGLLMKNVMPIIGKKADGNNVKQIIQNL